MKAIAELGARAALWWLDHRPLSKEKRAARKAARAARRRARRGETTDHETTETDLGEEASMLKILQLISGLRTSTKAGAVGLVPFLLLLVPSPVQDAAESYIQAACANPEGALPFILGGAVTWVVMFISARISRTPAKPGIV